MRTVIRLIGGIFCALILIGLAAPSEANPSATSIPGDTLGPRAAAGEQLYSQSCEFCHGQRAIGAQAPSLRNLGISVKEIETIISEGKTSAGMPAFKTTY